MKINKKYIIIGAVILLIAASVFSATTIHQVFGKKNGNTITEQKIKTIRITKTYQDVIAAQDLQPDHSQKRLDIAALNPGAELMSAFIYITEGFVMPNQESIVATLQSHGDKIYANLDETNNIFGSNISIDEIYSFTDESPIDMSVSTSNGVDLNNVSAGSMDIIISYIEH